MQLPDEKGKLNFIINITIPLSETRNGGLMVLHKLAYDLASRGHNAFIFTEPEYPHENIHVIESERKEGWHVTNNMEAYSYADLEFPEDKTIAIYPEIQTGNPLGTKHVMRWILYHTNPAIEETWSASDVYYNFGNFRCSRECQGVLRTVDYKLEVLYDENLGDRKGFCHILHKETPRDAEYLLNKFNSTDLTGWQKKGYDYLRKQLNEHEYLLLFDNKTFNAVAAILCGCKVISLQPDPGVSPLEYRKLNEAKRYGVAYGLSDISHANDTINFVPYHIKQMSDKQERGIDDFVGYWENRLL